MDFNHQIQNALSRRAFLRRSTTGIGALALGSLLSPGAFGASAPQVDGAMKSLH